MNSDSTLGDDLRNINMGWFWAFVVVAILLALGITPWPAILDMIENRGVTDEQWQLIGFVAGYTLPLTVGFCIIACVAVSGAYREINLAGQLFGSAIVLWLAGEVARALGLGLLPNYDNTQRLVVGTPPILRPLAYVLNAYFNTYGMALMICALVIGFVMALQIDRWAKPTT